VILLPIERVQFTGNVDAALVLLAFGLLLRGLQQVLLREYVAHAGVEDGRLLAETADRSVAKLTLAVAQLGTMFAEGVVLVETAVAGLFLA